MMVNNILALDCGTNTGWAALINDQVESGVQVFDLRRGESPGIRFIRFRAWIAEIAALTKPALIVYEQAHLRGGAATDLLVGMTTRIVEFCADKGIDYAAHHSGAIKKFATRNGAAGKAEMMAAAERIWRRVPADDNEADALCLLALADALYNSNDLTRKGIDLRKGR